MRAINHALTGAFIGLTVDNPELALPAAFASHFICDMIPHYGPNSKNNAEKQKALSGKLFKFSLILDAGLCILLVTILVIAKPHNWLSATICAFLATSPDLLWIRKYKDALKGKKTIPTRLDQLLSRIQWFEHPIGAFVEIAWFLTFSLLIWTLLK